MKTRETGFTLIELLVVITIIGLLAVALLPQVLGSQTTANKLADEQNLRWHYQNLVRYKAKYSGQLPRYGGHEFIFDPWARGVVEHTDQNRDRYFSPQIRGANDDYNELILEDVKAIWKDVKETTSRHTDYAGRASAHKKTMMQGDQVIMATDNEDMNIYPDGTVIVLFGDGATKQWNRDPDLAKYGYSTDVDSEEHVQVGPQSLHPELQKLDF